MCGNMPGAASGSPAPTVGTPATPKPVAAPVGGPAAPREPRNYSTADLVGTPSAPALPKAPSWNPGAGMTGLPKMHKGGTIPETGPYVMKAGEKVLTPENQRDLIDAFSAVRKILAEPDSETGSQPVKELSSMTIRRDKDPAKFSVAHKLRDGKAETHSVDRQGLASHVTKQWQLDKDANNETKE